MLLQQPVVTTENAVEFQNNINAVHKWSVNLKMPFSDKKCKVTGFRSRNNEPAYKLRETVMDWADTKTYLGAIMYSNFKFDQQMALKKDKDSKTLGAIKHILKQATRRLVTGLH